MYPKDPEPSKLAILRTKNPYNTGSFTLPLEGQMILRVGKYIQSEKKWPNKGNPRQFVRRYLSFQGKIKLAGLMGLALCGYNYYQKNQPNVGKYTRGVRLKVRNSTYKVGLFHLFTVSKLVYFTYLQELQPTLWRGYTPFTKYHRHPSTIHVSSGKWKKTSPKDSGKFLVP